MNDVKREMIFGDQSLFDGAPEDVEMIAAMPTFIFYKVLDGCVFTREKGTNWEQCPFNHPGIALQAMRRIIHQPKRWTLEDKKSGRLPGVGCEVILRTTGELATVNAVHKNMVCLTFADGEFSPFNIERIEPIETPEERAKREREEWCSKALDSAGILSEMKRYELKRLGEYIGSIHDALLSGELPMPTKGGE